MNWRRWIRPGLVGTVLVALIAVVARDGGIEADLGARVSAALFAEGQGWAAVDVSARDVAITGQAPSTESQDAAVRIAAMVAGVRQATNASALLPIASPYVWSARRTGNELALAGNIPSEAGRAAVLAAARRSLPEAVIRDEMALARGAPAGYSAATTFGLDRLADLIDGTVTLTDTTLALNGTAVDAAAFDRARSAIGGEIPAAVNLGPIDILPARADPYVWSAAYDGERVTVVGFVPNDIVHQTLLATIRASLPGVEVADNMAVASGEPAGFAEAASFAIAALERLNRGGVTLDGLSLDVSGEARSVDDHDALLSSLEGPFPKGMTVVASAVMPASVSPYFWQGERAAGRVVLTGYVPSAAALDDLSATAQVLFAGFTLDDRVRVATGEPRMDWIGAIKFAMGELAKLDRGKVTVGDQTYDIEGEAASPEAYMAILEANARTLPASLALGAADVTPPAASPYLFVAERRGAGVVVSGHTPDEDTRQAIFTAIHRKFGTAEITGDLIFASGAPDGYEDAATAALQVLSRIAGGRVEVSDTALTAQGFVFQPGAIEDVGETLASLPDGYTVDSTDLAARQPAQPVAAARCGELMQAVLKSGRIEFNGTQAEIAADSYGLLDRVAETMARCPSVGIEVGAHTDSEGSQSRNRDRTQARAEAIVDFLVDAGIRRERLTAVGYGEADPIADNDTEAGKAANRRIEFAVELPSDG